MGRNGKRGEGKGGEKGEREGEGLRHGCWRGWTPLYEIIIYGPNHDRRAAGIVSRQCTTFITYFMVLVKLFHKQKYE